MRREELAHLLRAAARITGDPHIVVIGSQAILATYPEDKLPADAWMSMEADVAFLDDPDGQKESTVDGAIGEDSSFHRENQYYAQGVDLELAVLPEGWRDRLVPFDDRSSAPAQALCLDKHDLVVSKLVANRQTAPAPAPTPILPARRSAPAPFGPAAARRAWSPGCRKDLSPRSLRG